MHTYILFIYVYLKSIFRYLNFVTFGSDPWYLVGGNSEIGAHVKIIPVI